MGRRQSGGDNSGVKKIMINNLCRETKNGDTLKDKDASSFVQVQNLCTTVSESNMEEAASSTVNKVNETVTVNNNASNAVSSSFSGGNLLFNIGSMMTLPMRKMLGLVGVDTSKITENAKNKVNSILNKNVEEKVKEDADADAEESSKTVVSKSNIEDKIVNRLENMSGGRRRTKKGKGKARRKSKGNKSVKRRRNRTKRR